MPKAGRGRGEGKRMKKGCNREGCCFKKCLKVVLQKDADFFE
jgi:hypothetical protein